MFKGYKTYIVAAVAVISAIASYLVGDMTLADAVQVMVPALLGATLRNAI